MPPRTFWKIFDKVMDGFAVLAGILLLLVTLFVSYSVTLRYLHLKPPVWILQCTEYALLWMTFLGAAWLLKHGGHIRIDTVVNRLEPKAQKILHIVVTVLGLVVCLVIIWFGTTKTLDLHARGIMDVKGVTLPKYPLFIIIPIGGLMLFLQFGRNLLEHVQTLNNKGSDGN
jgi:TRAP-type C4-dicarboxylate transport system permease small subunit